MHTADSFELLSFLCQQCESRACRVPTTQTQFSATLRSLSVGEHSVVKQEFKQHFICYLPHSPWERGQSKRTVSLQMPCRLWNPPRNSNFLWGFGLCGIDEHKQRGHRQKCCQQTFITIRWTSDNVRVVLNHPMPFHTSDWPISTVPADHPIRGSRLNCLIGMHKFPKKIK